MNSFINSDDNLINVLNILNEKPVVAELPIGKGKVFICQLLIDRFVSKEPVLKKLLVDMLK